MRERMTAQQQQVNAATEESRGILNKDIEERGLDVSTKGSRQTARPASWEEQLLDAAQANNSSRRARRDAVDLPDAVDDIPLQPTREAPTPDAPTGTARDFEATAYKPTRNVEAGAALPAEEGRAAFTTKVRGIDQYGRPVIDPVQDTLDRLRARATPKSAQDWAQDVLPGTALDPAFPHLTVGTATVDHIVSVSRIVQMEGFEKLSFEAQLRLVTMEANFAAVSKRVNDAKKELSYFEWSGLPGERADAKWLKEMQAKERLAERALRAELARLLDEEARAAAAQLRAMPAAVDPLTPRVPTGAGAAAAGVATKRGGSESSGQREGLRETVPRAQAGEALP
jgi:hypothetical protein